MTPHRPTRSAFAALIAAAALTLAAAFAVAMTVADRADAEPARPGAPAVAAVKFRAGIPYVTRGGGQPLELDAYLPVPAGEGRPAIILVHGGAWRRGDRTHVADEARTLARLGYPAFAIDYRRSTRHPFPAAVNDVAAATAFVRSRARSLGIDPARVVLLGASAGGNLAALAGTDSGAIRIAGGAPAAVISLSGPMDLRLMARHAAALEGCASSARRPLGCSVSESILARLPVLLGCPIDDRMPWLARTRRPAPCPGVYRRGSPVAHAGPGDAPMLLVQGAEDPLVPAAHARRMGAALRAGGVEHRVVIVPGSLHGTRLLAPALPHIRAFIDRR